MTKRSIEVINVPVDTTIIRLVGQITVLEDGNIGIADTNLNQEVLNTFLKDGGVCNFLGTGKLTLTFQMIDMEGLENG